MIRVEVAGKVYEYFVATEMDLPYAKVECWSVVDEKMVFEVRRLPEGPELKVVVAGGAIDANVLFEVIQYAKSVWSNS